MCPEERKVRGSPHGTPPVKATTPSAIATFTSLLMTLPSPSVPPPTPAHQHQRNRVLSLACTPQRAVEATAAVTAAPATSSDRGGVGDGQKKGVAFFDLDHTIIDTNSSWRGAA